MWIEDRLTKALFASRKRVNDSIHHVHPDRLPVDFLAVPDIWRGLCDYFHIIPRQFDPHNSLYDPNWEMVNLAVQNDCRVASYDQFIDPQKIPLDSRWEIDWFGSPARSTPNRMFRLNIDGHTTRDIWGRNFSLKETSHGEVFEETIEPPLAGAESIRDMQDHPWPNPDMWDFSRMAEYIRDINQHGDFQFRFRAGAVFEVAWQLTGFEEFLLNLSIQPELPSYTMETITDITLAVMHSALAEGKAEIDTVYFYDDVATQSSLLMSKETWKKYIKPLHQKFIDLARRFDKTVMYHCDGNIYAIIPDLIDMGIDVLNPLQPDARDMQPSKLKREFGEQLCFHGGVDIKRMVSEAVNEIGNDVKELVEVMFKGGGYVLAGSHHLQQNTPLDNIMAMYALDHRICQDKGKTTI